jgi:hypothetical protein
MAGFEEWWGNTHPVDPFGVGLLVAHHDSRAAWGEATRQERERCAALVEERGCICGFLLAARPAFEFRGKLTAGTGRLEQHDPNCPRALAAKIREGADA